MKIVSFIYSLLVATLIFFILYFIVPVTSEQFFGTSNALNRDIKGLRGAVEQTLDDQLVPKRAIEQYIHLLKEASFEIELSNAVRTNPEQVIPLIVKQGEGIDFNQFPQSQLNRILTEGLAKFDRTSPKKLNILKLVFDNAVEGL